MKFANNKKVVKTMIKDNSQAFIKESNSNMLFDSKFQGTVAKWQSSSKSKSKKSFGALSQQQQQTTLPALQDCKNKTLVYRFPYFVIEKAGGEVLSPRLVHNFINAEKEEYYFVRNHYSTFHDFYHQQNSIKRTP